MRRLICSIKAGALIDNFKEKGILYFWLFFALFFNWGLSYSATYKVNERTRIYTQEIKGDSVLLKIDNEFAVPVTANLFVELKNLQSSAEKEFSAVVPAKSIGHVLARYSRTDSLLPYKCSYSWRVVLGDGSRVPDKTYQYSYPYLKGKSYKITQGPNGDYSHKGMFAYDFLMPLGTPVTATRDGIVALIKSDSQTGGPDRKYIDEANFISVYHEDGTLANYIHLNTNGALVKEGQQVKKGEIIGYSGNTGFTSGPHLHFELIMPGKQAETDKWLSFNWEHSDNHLLGFLNKK